VQLAGHRKTSEERTAIGIVLRARVRACPTLRPGRERRGYESKEDERRAHDVWGGGRGRELIGTGSEIFALCRSNTSAGTAKAVCAIGFVE
jgi:hypothetical protein